MKNMTHQFLDWLKSKPADEEYDYSKNGGCAVSMFLREEGYADTPWCDSGGWGNSPIECGGNPRKRFWGAESVVSATPQTFGAAADRLAKLLQP